MIQRAKRVRAILAAILLAAVPAAPAFAYWELKPQVEGGITYETNPRYVSDEEESVVLPLNPDATDDVMGVYFDLRLEGAYKTPSTQIAITPRVRETNYLKSNKDLNDDDWYVDFVAAHTGVLGNVGLRSSYKETGVRTTEFESAVPDNPDDPVPVSGGSGRFSDDTQKTWNIEPTLNYQLSPRNLMGIAGQYAETTYDEQREDLLTSRTYRDYNYSSLELSMRHVLDSKNYFAVALTGGNFLAEEPGSLFENSTDSFGINAAYNRAFSDTLTGTLTVGFTRSSVDVSIGSGSTSDEERNFVGSLELRKRSESTTLNFSVASQIAPRSDGTEVVQEQARLYVDQTLTQKLTGSLGLLYSRESAVGQIFQPDSSTVFSRQDRNYFTVEPRISWRLTDTLSVYSSYIYVSDTTDVTGGDVEQTNNRLYFGVLYRGIGLRR